MEKFITSQAHRNLVYFQKSFQRNGYATHFYLLVLFKPRINIKNIYNRKNVSIYNFAQFRDYFLFVFF